MKLRADDVRQLEVLLREGIQAVRTVRRAWILRQLGQGESARRVATQVGVAVSNGIPGAAALCARRLRASFIRPAASPGPSQSWMRDKSKGSWPWCAVRRRAAIVAGAYVWLCKKRWSA